MSKPKRFQDPFLKKSFLKDDLLYITIDEGVVRLEWKTPLPEEDVLKEVKKQIRFFRRVQKFLEMEEHGGSANYIPPNERYSTPSTRVKRVKGAVK